MDYEKEIERLKDEITYYRQKLFWRWIFFLYGIGFGIVISIIYSLFHWLIAI